MHLAGIFHLLPALSILAVLGALYSLYVLYLGLLAVKHPPQDKAIPYTVVVVILAVGIKVRERITIGRKDIKP